MKTLKQKGFVIAIDGPVASGKGTIALLLSKKLHAIQIDTGSMYRAVALACKEQDINPRDHAAVLELLSRVSVEIWGDEDVLVSKVSLDGRDIVELIRMPDIAGISSIISAYPEVRVHLVAKQKELIKKIVGHDIPVVIEGRIVATEVVPGADFKLFLTASPLERAKRRLLQYEKKGVATTFIEVQKDTVERDRRDANHLPSNPEVFGYYVIDTTDLDEEQTLETIYKQLKIRKII